MGMKWRKLIAKNKKLALALLEDVLDAQTARSYDTDIDAFYRAAIGDSRRPAEDRYDRRVEKYLLGLPVDDVRLAKITSLTLDGDRLTYSLIGGFGEVGEPYRIRSLEGIELLTGLRALDLHAMVKGVSLKPLAALPKLRKLDIEDVEAARDYPALLKMGALRELGIANLSVEAATEKLTQVLLELARHGVVLTGVSMAAAKLKEAKRFTEALTLYDRLLEAEEPVLTDLLDATYSVMADNNGGPVQPVRAKRYVERALPYGPKLPGIFYNAACIAQELGDSKQALQHLANAVKHRYPNPEQMFQDKIFAPLRDRPTFKKLAARAAM